MKTAFNVRLKRYYHKREISSRGLNSIWKYVIDLGLSYVMWYQNKIETEKIIDSSKIRDRIDIICCILNTHHITISSCTYNLSQLE